MADYSKMTDQELMALGQKYGLVKPPVAPDYSKMSDAELLSLGKQQGIITAPDRKPMLAKMAEEDKVAMPSVGLVESFALGGMEGTVPGSSNAALRLAGGSKEDVSDYKEKVKKDNPAAYYTGYVGGLVNPFGLLGAAARGTAAALKAIPRTAGLVGTAPMLAPWISNAISGGASLGTANATEALLNEKGAKEAVKEGGKGLALGTLATPVIQGAGNLAVKGVTKAGGLAKKAFAALQGLKPETLDTMAEKGPQVADALQAHTQGNLIPSYIQDIGDKISSFVTQRIDKLDEILATNNTPISTASFVDAAKEQVAAASRIKATPLAVQQSKALLEQQSLLEQLPKQIPAADLNVIKKQFQEQLKRYYSDSGFSKDSLQSAVSKIENSVRESLNAIPGVKEINLELSKSINLQEALKIKNVFKSDAVLDPVAAQRFFATLGNEAKKPIEKAAQEFDALIGTDLVDKAKIFSAVTQMSSKGGDAFSLFKTGRALLGPALGAKAGAPFGPVGSAIGAGAGLALQSPMAVKPILAVGGLASKIGQFGGKALASEYARRPILKGISNLKGDK